MDAYWKDPRLNDEGTYDYLIEELPRDTAKWELSKYRFRCDECGKESHLLFCTAHHFYCWDGWDSMSWNACWKCMLSNEISVFKYKLKKRIRIIKCALNLYKMESKCGFKKCYAFAKEMER